MIKKENLDKTSAWPFVEAKKLLRERKSFIEKKGKITLQTGYGPSGLPHIGTFGEVARTSMMVNALKQLSEYPTEIITFSDDMDGLRKVPENVPNQELLNTNLQKPLTQVQAICHTPHRYSQPAGRARRRILGVARVIRSKGSASLRRCGR